MHTNVLTSRITNIRGSPFIFHFSPLNREMGTRNILFFKKIFGYIASLLQHSGFLSLPHGMWDPGSLTRDRAHIPCNERQILNHWTTRKVPKNYFLFLIFPEEYCDISVTVGSNLHFPSVKSRQ